MSYIIGISSGIFSIARQRAPEGGLPFMGLARKASFALTKGVRFVQLDLESAAEFNEPMLKEQIEKIREGLKIYYGIHSESRAFGGEIPYLDEAIIGKYHRAHERLVRILRGAVQIKATYVLVHSSESTPFLQLPLTLQPLSLADFWGRPISLFLKENKQIFVEWFKSPSSDFFFQELYQRYGKLKEVILREIENKLIEELLKSQELKQKIEQKKKQIQDEKLAAQQATEEFLEEKKEQIEKKKYELLVEEVGAMLTSEQLVYGAERYAYYLIAKWMEATHDPLWQKTIDMNINYYFHFDKKHTRGFEKVKTKEEWLEKKGIKKLSIDDVNFRKDYRLWVPAVSAKYIWGHFFPEKCPSYEGMSPPEDFKKIIDEGRGMEVNGKKIDFFFCLETPMSPPEIEEWTRLPNPLQFYWLVKEINKEKDYAAIAIDLEHILSSNIDPELIVELLPADGGKYIKVVHAGYPSVLQPAHIHLPIGIEQFFYLYKIYYGLRKKGMGKQNICFLIFERAEEQEIRYSIEALRIIAEHLEKDVEPEAILKEPLKFKKFWGLAPDQPMSFERQKAIIRLHAYDPLRGLLYLPEEAHTFLGKAAKEKGKLEEWRKEELR